jgi:hypothetical protein
MTFSFRSVGRSLLTNNNWLLSEGQVFILHFGYRQHVGSNQIFLQAQVFDDELLAGEGCYRLVRLLFQLTILFNKGIWTQNC